MEISLNPDIEQLITRHIQSGENSSVAEVIRTAVLQLHERLGQADSQQQASKPRRSPKGILADIRSYISPDDIAGASKEMGGFVRNES